MRYVWTRHIRRRMAERDITEADVEHALHNFTSSWTTKDDSVQYNGTSVDGRELRVYVVNPGLTDQRPVLKSAAWRNEDDGSHS